MTDNEHHDAESRANSNIDNELIPPEGNKEVGHKVFAVLNEVLADKEKLKLPQKWNYYYKLSKNKMWRTKTKAAHLVSMNLLHKNRQSKVNQLTDNNPTFNIARIGAEEGKEGVYDTLLHIAQHWWHDQEQQHVFRKSVLDGETNGCCIEKMIFNKQINVPIGEAETVLIDPFNFGFYPTDALDIQKADANLQYGPWSVREARRTWPEKASQIKADKDLLADLGEQRREIQSDTEGSSQGWFTKIANVVKHMWGNTANQTGGEVDEKCLIAEAWVKDYTQNEDGSDKYKGNIRMIVACNGGDLVLEDKSNPSINDEVLSDEQARKTYLYSRFPFSLTQSLTDNVSLWGGSDFDQLVGLNIELNKKISQYNLFVDRASRLKIINPKDSGVPNSAIDNYPGIINPTNRLVAQSIGYMDSPKNPLDLEKAIALYQEAFFKIANSFDMDQLRAGGNEVIAYKAIAALLENAQTMLKDKLGNYSRMLRIRGRMYISTVQNWYTEEMEIPFEDDGEERVEKVKGIDLIVPAKLTVISGSTMPISRVQKREEAIVLYDKQMIPLGDALKALDWPEWKKVARKMLEGPFGTILSMLAQMGAPEQFLQFMQQLFQTDPKDFEKALKAGDVPPFEVIAQPQEQIEQAPDPAQQMEAEKIRADADLKYAQVEKVAAEIELLEEKAISERIEQLVRSAGVELDEEKLKILRAEFVLEFQKAKEQELLNRDNASLNREKIAADLKKVEPQGTERYDKKKGQGPYREKGFKSNNKELE